MGTSTEHVMTIANSIIGVSVLAMPFCFKQCGIVLSILLLLLSGIMTRLACHYLLKSAITARRRNFEFLAFHAFGPTGKLCVELGIIGFMLGTCIAFFVVMGDLGPVIVGPALNIDSFSTLRPSVLMGLGLLVVLPLGLLKNVDSLSAVCAASIAFYLCLVFKVMAEATSHLISWDWVDKVNLWRPAGVPQCIPIFSMALSCQTQLFEIFDSVPNTSLEKMNAIIRSAINMCTAVYISVGFFGYIAFCTQNFSGNLLMSFSPTMTSDIIKLGFVLSVAVSFPLVIFPCRASLHSLLFRRGHTSHHELLSGGGNYIPESRFKCLTIFIVMFSLGTGLLIPSIEVVLGLVGSTIGIMICIMFPALTFICISNKNNNERLVAQGLFTIGLMIMILGTYTNLYATEEALSKPSVEIQKAVPPPLKPPANLVEMPPEIIPNVVKDKPKILDEKIVNVLPDIVKEIKTQIPVEIKKDKVLDRLPEEADSNKRKEPPVPVAPGDTVNEIKEDSLPPIPSVLSEIKEKKKEQKDDKVIQKPDDPAAEIKKDERISNDAIKREEEEIKESKDNINLDVQKKNEEILEKLSKHEEEQKKIIQEQKALLEEFKKQNEQQKLQQKQRENVIVNQGGSSIVDKITNKNLETKEKDGMIEMKVKLPKEVLVKNDALVGSKIENSLLSNLSKNLPVSIDVVEKLAHDIPSSKDKTLTPIMANKMVNGVPLPLVIKDNLSENKLPVAIKDINESKKVDNSLNNKPMIRDILGENKKFDKEEREKRDLDTVDKMDESLKVVKPKVDGSISSNDVDNKGKVTSGGIKDHPKEEVQSKGIKDSVKTDNSVEKGGSLVKVLNEEKKVQKENCPKAEKEKDVETLETRDSKLKVSEHNIEENEIFKPKEEKQIPVNDQDFIKTPSFLSNPEVPDIDATNVKIGEPARNSIQELKPRSRDLKSLQNAEETRRQERAAEIT